MGIGRDGRWVLGLVGWNVGLLCGLLGRLTGHIQAYFLNRAMPVPARARRLSGHPVFGWGQKVVPYVGLSGLVFFVTTRNALSTRNNSCAATVTEIASRKKQR